MPTVLKVRLTGFVIGQMHENIVYFERTGAVSDEPIVLAQEIRDNWCVLWKPMLPTNQFFWTNIKVNNVDAAQTSPVNLAVNITGSGGAFTGICPFMTYSIRKLTQFAGRKGRGRMYLGCVNQANLASGIIVAANLNTINAICANVMGRYGSTGTSGYSLTLFAEDGDRTSRLVTSLFCDNIPRVQRRRNIGQGA